MSSLTQRLPRKYKEQYSLQDAALNYAQFKAYDTTWPLHMSRIFNIQEYERKLQLETDFSHQPSNRSRLLCLGRVLNLSRILMLRKSTLFEGICQSDMWPLSSLKKYLNIAFPC